MLKYQELRLRDEATCMGASDDYIENAAAYIRDKRLNSVQLKAEIGAELGNISSRTIQIKGIKICAVLD